MDSCKALCKKCSIVTNHIIIAEEKISDVWEQEGIRWWETYQIIKCKGCDSISFRKSYCSSDDIDFETGKLLEYVELFPERGVIKKNIPDSTYFPEIISNIYNEMLSAYNKRLFLLSTIGLRMLIEAICIEEKISGKNLLEKIDELSTKGLISNNQKDFLHKLRFLGNYAAHEIKAPKANTLLDAIDIAETLLKAIYILPEKSKKINNQ